MPLKPGSSDKVISNNIREFHGGKTYNHTKAKFGKKRADKQAVAVALSNARRHPSGGLVSKHAAKHAKKHMKGAMKKARGS